MAPAEESRCPVCGDPVPADATRCDNCGAAIGKDEHADVLAMFDSLEEEMDAADVAQAAPTADADRAAQGSTLYLCPSCGAFVSSAEAHCPKCGADLAAEPAAASATPSLQTRLCSHCGSTIPVTAEICPACRNPVAEEPELEVIKGLCPSCGSVAPTGRQTCAVCGASLRGKETPAAKAAAKAVGRPLQPAPSVPPTHPPAAPGPPTPRDLPASRPSAGARPLPPPPPPEPVRAVPPPRPRSATGAVPHPHPARRPTPRIASLREMSAVATLLVLPAVAVARSVPGHEWGDLFTFGALFAIALGLTVPDLRQPFRDRIDLALFLGAVALLLAVPVLAYRGGIAGPVEDVLLVAGSALLAAVVWRLRRGVGPYLAWIAGLLLLSVLALSPFVLAAPGPFGGDAVSWGLAAGLAFAAAAFIAIRRWLRGTADAGLARADAAYTRREYDKAIVAYEATIAMARRAGLDVPAGWYGKGAALVAAGRFEEALVALDRALALSPENEIAWINKGTALTRLGRMNEALRCFNTAIKVNPRYEVAWNNKANALARLGKADLALACYEKALEIDPAYRTAWVNKGFVLAKLGRFEEAAACADAALKLTTGAVATA